MFFVRLISFVTAIFLAACAGLPADPAASPTPAPAMSPPDAKTPIGVIASAYAQSCVRAGQEIKCPEGRLVAIDSAGKFQCRPSFKDFPFVKDGEKPCKGIQ
jgi:hypothetical protein